MLIVARAAPPVDELFFASTMNTTPETLWSVV